MTTHARAGPPLPLWDGGGAVDWMIELLSSYMFLTFHAPLAAFVTTRGNWSVWTQAWATAALHRVEELVGLPVADYVLHSLRIEDASLLSAGRASAGVL